MFLVIVGGQLMMHTSRNMVYTILSTSSCHDYGSRRVFLIAMQHVKQSLHRHQYSVYK